MSATALDASVMLRRAPPGHPPPGRPTSARMEQLADAFYYLVQVLAPPWPIQPDFDGLDRFEALAGQGKSSAGGWIC